MSTSELDSSPVYPPFEIITMTLITLGLLCIRELYQAFHTDSHLIPLAWGWYSGGLVTLPRSHSGRRWMGSVCRALKTAFRWRGVSSGLPSPHAASLCRLGCGREFLRKWNTSFTFTCILFMCKNNSKVATNLQWPLPWGPSDLQVEGDIKIYSLWIFCDKLNNLETLGLHCLL